MALILVERVYSCRLWPLLALYPLLPSDRRYKRSHIVAVRQEISVISLGIRPACIWVNGISLSEVISRTLTSELRIVYMTAGNLKGLK